MIDTIVIFGSNGMLGRYITSFFKQYSNLKVIPLTREEYTIDCNSWVNLESIFFKYKCNEHTCVVNCIGSIPQRYVQNGSINYYVINSIFPHVLASICKKYGVKMIQPTTDCVYSGTRGKYLETDPHDEENHYGRSKSIGEPLGVSVLRVSIIGEELENKKSFLEWVRNTKDSINGWQNHYWNGITCLEYCKVIQKIIMNNMFWEGIRHIYSPTVVSKYDMVCMVNNIYNLNLNVKSIKCEQTIDKTLSSKYSFSEELCIPSLETQIIELKTFKLIPSSDT